MKIILQLLLFISISSSALCQIKTQEKRKFNIGISDGLGGLFYLKLYPALDLRYKGTNVRLGAGNNFLSLGVTQEIMSISKIFDNKYWVASTNFTAGKYVGEYYNNGKFISSDITSFGVMALTGLKFYFGNRFYSYLQIGVLHVEDRTPVKSIHMQWTSPYGEFSIGINLSKNFKQKK